jgi:hypothetical protein
MIEMTRLLRLRGFKIDVVAPDLCVRLLQLSATVKDADVAHVRAQLLGIAPPECLEAVGPISKETPRPASEETPPPTFEENPLPVDEQPVERLVGAPAVPTVVELFSHDICDGSFACPSCQRVLPMPRVWPRSRNAKPLVCPCGQLFRLRPNTRKFRRKPVNLAGYCSDMAEASPPSEIIINDLSYGGMQFRVTGSHTLQIGMQLQVHFTLPDKAAQKIQQTICIRHVEGQTVGASWDETEPFAAALALFLM